MFRTKMSQIDTENDKNAKISNFQKLYAFCFPNFRQTLWIGTLKRVNKQKMLCPVSFSEEFFAVFR